MILTSGNGLFSFVDGVTSTARAGIDAAGNLQIDGILDEDLAITIADDTIATVTGAGGSFSIIGSGLQVDIGDSFDDDLTVDGDFQCTGTKSFLQNHPYEKDLSIWYVALEGDEPGTYTRGSGRVSNGVARVPLGETFAWVTNPDIGLTAHVTPRGEWADLYVESVTPKEIVVRSRDASVPAAFDFIVYGLRIGYEDFPVVRQKTTESTVPSETEYARQYYVDRPELRALSPLARFQRMEAEAGVAHREPTASRALRQAIGEHHLEAESVAAQGPVEAADDVEPESIDERQSRWAPVPRGTIGCRGIASRGCGGDRRRLIDPPERRAPVEPRRGRRTRRGRRRSRHRSGQAGRDEPGTDRRRQRALRCRCT